MNPATVIINAAGRARRMGLNTNKALIEFQGKPLIAWQLESVPRDVEVVVGLGFQADQVLSAAQSIRKGISHVTNACYLKTGTAATLSLVARSLHGRVVSLDGDLLVHPEDLLAFIYSTEDLLGIGPLQSEEPIGVSTQVIAGTRMGKAFLESPFQLENNTFEWTGLVNFDPQKSTLGNSRRNVHHMLEPSLPCKTRMIRSTEIDYEREIPSMDTWIRRHLAPSDG